jgi:hypothetical protein
MVNAFAVLLVVHGLITPSWSDAKFGLIASGIAAAGVVFGFSQSGAVQPAS